MKTTKVTIGGLNFDAQLEGQDYDNIERALKKSIFNVVLGDNPGDESLYIPRKNELVIILAGACKESNISQMDVKRAVDAYLDKGGQITEVYGQTILVLQNSGFFGKTEDGESSMTNDMETSEVEELI